MRQIITLTTDFGLTDEYAGVMKGVILTLAPEARIVDLTHGIRRQDINAAACLIGSAYKFFPERSIHIVVVDPGVGGKRRLVLLCKNSHLFLAPDNGVLTLLLDAKVAGEKPTAYEITNSALFPRPVGNTFHGRDIMAPVAARLATGSPPSGVGRQLPIDELLTLPLLREKINHKLKSITGAVITVDHFGNLLTNIQLDAYVALTGAGRFSNGKLIIKNHVIHGLSTSYDCTPPGVPLAIFGSRGCLEIAANRDSAAEILNAGPGEQVILSCPAAADNQHR